MKDYNEMTQSVLQQAKIRAAQQKHRRRIAAGLIAAALCLAVVITALGGGWDRDPAGSTQPTHSMQSPTTEPTAQPTISVETPTTTPPTQPEATDPGTAPNEVVLYLLSCNETQLSQTQLLKDVKVPIDGRIRVRRFYGMSEAERRQAISEEKAAVHEYLAGSGPFSTGVTSVSSALEGMVSVAYRGSLTLEFKDKDQYGSVDIETTGVGEVSGASMIVSKTTTYGEGEDQITYPAGTMLYTVHWHLSTDIERRLINFPDEALSTISDTITITVNFSNGETQIIVVDVTVDDDGSIYMTRRDDNIGL